MTDTAVANAICMGFSELGVGATIYDSPPSSKYAGIIAQNSCGPWTIIIEYADNSVVLWPPRDGNRLIGPPLSDPQFFEKCVALMVSENIRYVK